MFTLAILAALAAAPAADCAALDYQRARDAARVEHSRDLAAALAVRLPGSWTIAPPVRPGVVDFAVIVRADGAALECFGDSWTGRPIVIAPAEADLAPPVIADPYTLADVAPIARAIVARILPALDGPADARELELEADLDPYADER